MPLSTFYTDFIASECRELGLTLDDLRAWRPPKGFGKRKKKRASKKKSAKKKAAKTEPTASEP